MPLIQNKTPVFLEELSKIIERYRPNEGVEMEDNILQSVKG